MDLAIATVGQESLGAAELGEVLAEIDRAFVENASALGVDQDGAQ